MPTETASTSTPVGDAEARMHARRAAVASTVADIRAIETNDGVNRPALERIAAVLDQLATHPALFGTDDFPDPEPGQRARLYRLSEDEDGRFALYLTCAQPGGSVPPHNHDTWAVVSGLSGEELNTLWRRLDDNPGEGATQIEVRDQALVTGGAHLALMPEDIHSVDTPGEVPRRHFHMYGRSLERITTRYVYDTEGGTRRLMEINPKIVTVDHA
jgi:predicted metal-dependent enzyme (double-stranded beta helix superfamily)